MDMQIIINQMIQLFLIIGLGYFLYLIGIFDVDMNQKLTKFTLSITTPALIISSVLSNANIIEINSVLFTLFIAVIIHIFLFILSFIYIKLLNVNKEQRGLYIFMVLFGNVSFMGFPVIGSIFGVDAIFYMALFNMIFNLFLFSIGNILVTYSHNSKIEVNFKNLLNPGVISSLLALVIYFLNITFPVVIKDTINVIGSMTTPLAMLLIGSTLATMELKEIFNDKKVYCFTLLRQIVIPMITFPFLNSVIADKLTLGITFIVISLPVANSSILFATRYGGDYKLAAKTVFITTLVSVFSIPLLVYLYLI